jgi:hypothetical protein
MYRKPRFLEELHAIREEMSRECDYDIDLFAEMIRSGRRPSRFRINTSGDRRTPAPKLNDESTHSSRKRE